MYRYPDGTFRVGKPAYLVIDGHVIPFDSTTPEQRAAKGYYEARPVQRKAFTSYETRWELGQDLIYREVVIDAVEDATARDEALAGQVRDRRDALLRACDWTQLPDTALSDERAVAWAAYRQALRDVPQQEDFPKGVMWPEVS